MLRKYQLMQKYLNLKGNARNILTAERMMLNFIQMLSATATTTNNLVKLISQYDTKLLDTRARLSQDFV